MSTLEASGPVPEKSGLLILIEGLVEAILALLKAVLIISWIGLSLWSIGLPTLFYNKGECIGMRYAGSIMACPQELPKYYHQGRIQDGWTIDDLLRWHEN